MSISVYHKRKPPCTALSLFFFLLSLLCPAQKKHTKTRNVSLIRSTLFVGMIKNARHSAICLDLCSEIPEVAGPLLTAFRYRPASAKPTV